MPLTKLAIVTVPDMPVPVTTSPMEINPVTADIVNVVAGVPDAVAVNVAPIAPVTLALVGPVRANPLVMICAALEKLVAVERLMPLAV